LDKKRPIVSIIIPTKDRKPILLETLEALKESLTDIDHEVIIINDSEEELILKNLGLRVKCFKNLASGVASARNYGASIAAGYYLLFLDDDMLINSEVISSIMKDLCLYENVCLNVKWEYPEKLKESLRSNKFGRFLEYYGFTSLRGWHKNHVWKEDEIFQVNSVTSQFLFMEMRVFKSIGGYNEQFPFAGFEDYDLMQRINAKNIGVVINAKLYVYHNERDRATDIIAWMARRARGGKTRRVAVEQGYDELTLDYGKLKSKIYQFVNRYPSVMYLALRLVPNLKFFDTISFFVTNLLYGAAVYRGYWNDNVK